VPRIHTTELSVFVRCVDDCGGDLASAEIRERFYPLEVAFDTVVDRSADPFSAAYFDQQIKLYREVSGRDLDQNSGELHDGDWSSLIAAPNPTGVADAAVVAENMRTLTTMLSLSALGQKPRILDLGAGHGLSSEIYAYAGCAVHAIDIDPALGELSRRRATAHNLDIVRSEMNFDDLSGVMNAAYDAAFFFQSLHHCLRPWDLIQQLTGKLAPGGIIAFAGEPIQDTWWKNWGIRLDPESLYVARRRGWFENGWSLPFIRQCFERNGMALAFFTGGLSGGEIGIATGDPTRLEEIRERARALGLSEMYPKDGLAIRDSLFRTASGRPTTLLGRPAFTKVADRRGALIFGPYVDVDAGWYEVSLLAQRSTRAGAGLRPSTLTLDVVSEGTASPHLRQRHGGWVSAGNLHQPPVPHR
jgi:SAM-dependent methyltransferase